MHEVVVQLAVEASPPESVRGRDVEEVVSLSAAASRPTQAMALMANALARIQVNVDKAPLQQSASGNGEGDVLYPSMRLAQCQQRGWPHESPRHHDSGRRLMSDGHEPVVSCAGHAEEPCRNAASSRFARMRDGHAHRSRYRDGNWNPAAACLGHRRSRGHEEPPDVALAQRIHGVAFPGDAAHCLHPPAHGRGVAATRQPCQRRIRGCRSVQPRARQRKAAVFRIVCPPRG